MTLTPYLTKHFLKFFLFLLFCFFIFLFSGSTNAYSEKDLKKISSKLRCMTCQNQSIYDSDADFSKDIKKIIVQKLESGHTEKEIIKFLVKRYGEYIVFEPQMNIKNYFLWFFPFVILAISLIFLIFRIKKN